MLGLISEKRQSRSKAEPSCAGGKKESLAGGSVVKNPLASAGDRSSIPGPGRSPRLQSN